MRPEAGDLLGSAAETTTDEVTIDGQRACDGKKTRRERIYMPGSFKGVCV